MNFIWLSDIQLDFLSPLGVAEWIKEIVEEKSDGLIISGNIATGAFITSRLQLISAFYMKNIYFVLGENDYKGHSYSSLYHELTDLTELNLKWLAQGEPVSLTKDTVIVGADTFPSNLSHLDKEKNPSLVEHTEKVLASACKGYKKVIFIVSSSPFTNTKPNEIGVMVLNAAKKNPSTEITVLSGQSAKPSIRSVKKNVTEYMGGSKYGSPRVCGRLKVDNTLSLEWDE